MTTENKSSLRKIVTASAPFNNPAADLVVRTSDRTQFHVVKAVLAVASPVFADMFSVAVNLPSETDSPSDYNEGTPILNVTESSGTMDTLLRLCYPVDNPEASSDDIDAIIDILAAGKKYEIEVAQTWCMSTLKNFASASHPDHSKFRIFVVAYQWGFEDLMLFVAKCLLTNSMADILSVSIPELTKVDARMFQRLWTYRQKCEIAVIRQAAIDLWFGKWKRPWAPLWIKGISVCRCKQVKVPVFVSENNRIDVGTPSRSNRSSNTDTYCHGLLLSFSPRFGCANF